MNIQFHGTSQQGKGVFVQSIPDAISLSVNPVSLGSGSYSVYSITTVTSSQGGSPATWTASIIDNPDNFLSLDGGGTGSSGSDIFITANENVEVAGACRTATLSVTCGEASVTLYINQDNIDNPC